MLLNNPFLGNCWKTLQKTRFCLAALAKRLPSSMKIEVRRNAAACRQRLTLSMQIVNAINGVTVEPVCRCKCCMRPARSLRLWRKDSAAGRDVFSSASTRSCNAHSTNTQAAASVESPQQTLMITISV